MKSKSSLEKVVNQANAELITQAPTLLAERDQLKTHVAELVAALKNLAILVNAHVLNSLSSREIKDSYSELAKGCEDASKLASKIKGEK